MFLSLKKDVTNIIKINVSGKMWHGTDNKKNNDVTKDILIVIPRTYEYTRLHGNSQELIVQIKLGLLIILP